MEFQEKRESIPAQGEEWESEDSDYEDQEASLVAQKNAMDYLFSMLSLVGDPLEQGSLQDHPVFESLETLALSNHNTPGQEAPPAQEAHPLSTHSEALQQGMSFLTQVGDHIAISETQLSALWSKARQHPEVWPNLSVAVWLERSFQKRISAHQSESEASSDILAVKEEMHNASSDVSSDYSKEESNGALATQPISPFLEGIDVQLTEHMKRLAANTVADVMSSWTAVKVRQPRLCRMLAQNNQSVTELKVKVN